MNLCKVLVGFSITKENCIAWGFINSLAENHRNKWITVFIWWLNLHITQKFIVMIIFPLNWNNPKTLKSIIGFQFKLVWWWQWRSSWRFSIRCWRVSSPRLPSFPFSSCPRPDPGRSQVRLQTSPDDVTPVSPYSLWRFLRIKKKRRNFLAWHLYAWGMP